MTWFLAHVVLASTASRSTSLLQKCSNLLGSADGVTIHTLTGCSKTLLCLLVDIADLAESMPSKSPKSLGFTSDQGAFDQRRHDLEARLSEHPFGTDAESERYKREEPHLPEVQRLATLIYFYVRVDESGPHEGQMRHLTAKILRLLPLISLRTTTLLWPLFIVGVFGSGVIRDWECRYPLTFGIITKRRVHQSSGMHGGEAGKSGANYWVQKLEDEDERWVSIGSRGQINMRT